MFEPILYICVRECPCLEIDLGYYQMIDEGTILYMHFEHIDYVILRNIDVRCLNLYNGKVISPRIFKIPKEYFEINFKELNKMKEGK